MRRQGTDPAPLSAAKDRSPPKVPVEIQPVVVWASEVVHSTGA